MKVREGKDCINRVWQGYQLTSEKKALYVVLFSFVLVALSFLFVLKFFPGQNTLFLIYCFVLSCQVIVGILLAKGSFRLARLFAVVTMWLFFTIVGLLFQGSDGVKLAGYLMIMIVAGFSLGPDSARWVFRFSLVAFFVEWGLRHHQILTPPMSVPSNSLLYLTFSIVLILSSIYLNYIFLTLSETLASSKKIERRYRALFDFSQDSVLLFDLSLVVIEVNQKGEELFGYSRSEIIGKNAADLFQNMEEVEEVVDDLLKLRKLSAFEHQIIRQDNTLIDVESLPTLVSDDQENPVYFQIILRDVRSRKKFEATLMEYQQRYQAMFDQIEYALFLLSMDLTVVAANPKASEMIGLPLKDLISSSITNYITPEERSAFRQNFTLGLSERHLPTTHYTIVDTEGHRLWGETTLSVVEDQENRPVYMQWIVRNVTGQKKREQELEKALNDMEALAMTDPLTGLPNRRAMQQFAMTALEDAWVKNTPVSLIMLDVDLLKKINDSYGHASGDLALCHVANVLSNQKRGNDAASRWAGDEFLIILPGTNLHHAELAAIRFRQHIESKVLENSEGQKFKVDVCLGVAGTESMPPEATLSLNTLLNAADNALYEAKQAGRGRVVVTGAVVIPGR